VDGHEKNVDQTASIFSGAYSLSLKKLDVLISNMDDSGHVITLPSSIGGYTLGTKDFTIDGGEHLLIEYSLGGPGSKTWVAAPPHNPFSGLTNNRNGFGIPEPGTLSILTVASVIALNRRRKRAGGVKA
jgi:hypothetical protein